MNIYNTAVILAGGKSRRMGFDKQFLEIENIRLIDKIIDALEEEFDEIIIVTNKPEEYKNFKAKVITDIIKGQGPLSGIHAGLKESSSNYIYLMACDMPNINRRYIRLMKENIKNTNVDCCIIKDGDRIEPFHGFYSKNIIKIIEERLKENKRSVHDLIININAVYMDKSLFIRGNNDLFLNLNTQEDVKEYLDILRDK